jgi:hypothetical protein
MYPIAAVSNPSSSTIKKHSAKISHWILKTGLVDKRLDVDILCLGHYCLLMSWSRAPLYCVLLGLSQGDQGDKTSAGGLVVKVTDKACAMIANPQVSTFRTIRYRISKNAAMRWMRNADLSDGQPHVVLRFAQAPGAGSAAGYAGDGGIG